MNEIILRHKSQDHFSFERHQFPIIDFKFVNSGKATAVLSAYHIVISKATVDITPLLRYDWRLLGPGSDSANDPTAFWGKAECAQPMLAISAKNVGWGEASQLSIQLGGSKLPRLFSSRTDLPCNPSIDSDSSTTLTATVKDEDPVVVHLLQVESIDKSEFRRLSELDAAHYKRALTEPETPYRAHDMSYHTRHALTSFLDAGKAFVVIEDLSLEWECLDVLGKKHSGTDSINLRHRWGTVGGALILTEDGFNYFPGAPLFGATMPPGPTFCALIDPDLGLHTRSYSISRRIDPGDAERFQVLIGAIKSCSLELRLSFDVDGEGRVLSQIFELDIENRRDQRLHNRYRDGQEILARVTEEQEVAFRRTGRPFTEEFD